jgi:hypothetical protein
MFPVFRERTGGIHFAYSTAPCTVLKKSKNRIPSLAVIDGMDTAALTPDQARPDQE